MDKTEVTPERALTATENGIGVQPRNVELDVTSGLTMRSRTVEMSLVSVGLMRAMFSKWKTKGACRCRTSPACTSDMFALRPIQCITATGADIVTFRLPASVTQNQMRRSY